MMIITKIGEILVEVCGDSTAAIAFASRKGARDAKAYDDKDTTCDTDYAE